MTAIPQTLDHIVLAAPSLAEAVASVEQRTGVRARPGGRHPTGTANALIAFTVDGGRGRHYLEVIGPDAEAGVAQDAVETFGIRHLSAPTVAAYALHPVDIDASASAAIEEGYDLGPVSPYSRTTTSGELLEWRLTLPPSGGSPAVPFLIDWGETPHPGLGELPTLELVRFVIRHPEPERIRALLGALTTEIDVIEHEVAGLELVVAGPDGDIVLG